MGGGVTQPAPTSFYSRLLEIYSICMWRRHERFFILLGNFLRGILESSFITIQIPILPLKINIGFELLEKRCNKFLYEYPHNWKNRIIFKRKIVKIHFPLDQITEQIPDRPYPDLLIRYINCPRFLFSACIVLITASLACLYKSLANFSSRFTVYIFTFFSPFVFVCLQCIWYS